jgi:hypothetical protein
MPKVWFTSPVLALRAYLADSTFKHHCPIDVIEGPPISTGSLCETVSFRDSETPYCPAKMSKALRLLYSQLSALKAAMFPPLCAGTDFHI